MNISDEEIEQLWDEFEDILFVEDNDSDDSCKLVLANDWKYWCKGTTRDDIWHWFDVYYSKGLSTLL